MRKRSVLLVAGACLATLTLTIGSAVADPTTPTPAGPRALAGVGSDTTERVLNGLAGDTPAFAGIKLDGTNKTIASYDASGSADITTKGAAGSAPCTFPRPSGSGNGINRLVAERNSGNHCVQFARSSSNDAASRNGQHLTYIPFGVDAVAYVVREFSNVSRNLSKATLLRIYQCDPTLPTLSNFAPLLPQFGSGTRKFFLEKVLNVPGGDRSTYTTEFNCVKDKQADGVTPLLENSGKLLTNDKQLVPYSVGVWISQVSKTPGVDDDHGITLLGNIDSVNTSLQLNSSAVGARDVYNVVPNKLVADGPNSKAVFVGPASEVCKNTATIKRFGFASHPSCGDPSIKSDSALGTDTVGAGE